MREKEKNQKKETKFDEMTDIKMKDYLQKYAK